MGAAGAAVVALLQMWDARDALYAQNRYMALSDVADAWKDALDAMAAKDPVRVRYAVLDFDNRVEIIHAMRNDGGMEDPAWSDFVVERCRKLNAEGYYGHVSLFSATKAMCDEEKKLWQENAGKDPSGSP